MRPGLVILHRWVGVAIALFLIVAGLTGAVISWDHELDGWLNPQLWHVSSRGDFLSPFELAARIEAADPRGFVTYLPLHAEIGTSVSTLVDARVDPATGKLFDLGYNQVFIDPVTGEILGRREWGEIGLDREHLIPFLYKLHFSLCIPEMWGVEQWGVWLMGGVALFWIIDCFVGFALTLPPGPLGGAVWRARWSPAWRIKWTASTYRATFDIHRAFGLWLWALLFILAVSAASLNLNKEVAQPIVNFFSTFTPAPTDLRVARPVDDPIMPRIPMPEIVARANEETARREFNSPAGSVGYAQQFGVYSVQFFAPGDEHGAAGVGPMELYFDGEDGRFLGDRIPWRGTAGDLFLQIQFPLHSGRIAGLAGRIVISMMGVVVAALSVTGLVIWWRKLRGRAARAAKSVRDNAHVGEPPGEMNEERLTTRSH
ncbi:PepSY-associated TM helix domain-containing protein [Methylocapsa palsarum]|nr:PepSY-associated TM helix domain-containing protein [Methylocapsa palsarum]